MSDFDDFLEFHRSYIERDPSGWFRWAVFMHRWQFKGWFMRLLNQMGEVIVARTKGGKNGAAGKAQGGSVWFVNVSVSVSDAAKIDEYFDTVEAVYDAMVAVMEDGYRVAFNYDMSRDAVVASLTCRNEGLPNHNGVLNAFAGDWFTALRVVLYKHYVVLSERWSDGSGMAARPAFG